MTYHKTGTHYSGRAMQVPFLNLNPDLDEEIEPPCSNSAVADWFFEPDNLGRGRSDINETREREEAAKRICGGCPFLVKCGLHGLKHEDYGVWGGLTEADRRDLGGRGIGHVSGGRPGKDAPKRIAHRLIEAGVPVSVVASLFEAWGREQGQRKAVA